MEFEFDGKSKISRLPRPKITLSKLKHEARTRVDDIFKNQMRLKCILGRYEDMLRKRWTKKTSEQRKQVLLSAWPSMPSTHRPDFHELRRKPVPQRQNNPDFKEPFLFPHINLEDLTQSKTILLFVDSRANHTPDTFANSDFNSIHLGLTSQIILPVIVDDEDIWCHMRLTGQKTAETYGHLRHFQDDDAAFDHLTYHYGMEPGEGLLVLEIQQRIMRFLLLCVELVLHDLQLNDLSETIAMELPSDGIITTYERPPLETAIFESPYRVPDQFDFVRLQSYVYAKRAEAKDHLWSLREDPAYFADTVRDASEHGKNEAFSREGSNDSPLLGSYLRENVFTSVVADAYSCFSLWDLVWQDLGRLVAVRDRHGVLNSSGQRLPEDCKGAQCHFSYLVEQGTKTLLDRFRAGVVASPPLRKHFIRSSQDLNSIDLQVVAKSNSHNDHLLWIVNQLADSNLTNLCGLQSLLDELERLIRNDTNQRQRISPWVASLISDLAVLGELKRQIELSSPGPAMWGITFVVESKLKEEYSRKTILVILIAAATSRSIEISGTGDPLKRFNYPWESYELR
ncbi:hypothetical protein MMC28_003428 [Mycoblastus sanguinarius]|nr:hypothetical protein [Mycoblastus sanguinarius]